MLRTCKGKRVFSIKKSDFYFSRSKQMPSTDLIIEITPHVRRAISQLPSGFWTRTSRAMGSGSQKYDKTEF